MSRAVGFGYYGKLPMAGDFLRGGLSVGFVDAWDIWMQRTLEQSRTARAPEAWWAAYLRAPIWRFSVAPGLLGPRGAVGIVMPSHDRVGRAFPFCVACETDLPPLAANLAAQPVVERLERAVLSMTVPDASLMAFKDHLAQLPGLADVPPGLGQGGGSIWVTASPDVARLMCVPELPAGPAQTAALFDAQAPYWQPPQPTRPEYFA
ncbi:type VI secretion system-associated protein TagF [Roseobacter sp.]|uniref:type VI secretion system-associated protein TagF n=1 Tax=Roseobacter sp. TaxID=1907202 RepID=UPI00329A02B4